MSLNKKQFAQLENRITQMIIPLYFSQAALVAFLHEKDVIDADEFVKLSRLHALHLSGGDDEELISSGIEMIADALETWRVDNG